MRKIFVILVFTGIIYSIAVCENIPMTWNGVLSEAEKSNPVLIKAEKDVYKSRLGYYSSWSPFLPQISANAGVSQSESDFSGWSKSYSYGFSGRLSLFSGFGDISQTRSKKLEMEISEIEYKRTLSDTVYNLKKSFTELLWAQETVLLSEEILKRRTENFELVKFKYDVGREDKGSFLKVEADRYKAESDLAKARRNIRTASAKLLRDIGKDTFEVIAVSGSFTTPPPPAAADFGALLKNIPEYLVAENNLQKSKYGIKAAAGEFYPDISLTGSVSKTGEQWAPRDDRRSVGLSLSYQIFSGRSDEYNLQIARTNEILAAETLRQTKYQIISDLESAWSQFADASEDVKVREKYLVASVVQSRITKEKYINGLVSYYDWYVVENDFTNAQRQLLDAKKSLVLAEASWKNILGKTE